MKYRSLTGLRRNPFRSSKRFVAAAALLPIMALDASCNNAQAAPIDQAGQTMGVDIATPRPDGFYFSNLASYGQSSGRNSGFFSDLPVLTYATPVRFLDSSIALTYSAPFVYQHGAQITNPTGTSRVDDGPQAFGPTIAHSFYNGFSTSLTGLIRPPTQYFNADLAASIILAFAYQGPFGLKADVNFLYSGTFGGHSGTPFPAQAALAAGQTLGYSGASDGLNVDYTLRKRFGGFELGFVGFASTELNTRLDDVGFNVVGVTPTGQPVLTAYDKRLGVVGVGGLVGYDFKRFSVQAMVTREIAKRFDYNGAQGLAGNVGYGEKETRGWLRVIVPYILSASSPSSIIAKY